MTVVPIKNAGAIEELDRLRDQLLSGEATKFYAFTDAEDPEDAVVYGGDWDMTELVAVLGALQSMEIKSVLDTLFEATDEFEEEDYPEE
jgi:hypothetical protein